MKYQKSVISKMDLIENEPYQKRAPSNMKWETLSNMASAAPSFPFFPFSIQSQHHRERGAAEVIFERVTQITFLTFLNNRFAFFTFLFAFLLLKPVQNNQNLFFSKKSEKSQGENDVRKLLTQKIFYKDPRYLRKWNCEDIKLANLL